MSNVAIEPHFYAILASSGTACELVELLPEADLTEELKSLLEIQYDIICHLVQGKHFGSDRLNEFIEYSERLTLQAIRIKDAP